VVYLNSIITKLSQFPPQIHALVNINDKKSLLGLYEKKKS